MINGGNVFISIRADNGQFYPIACDLSCTITFERPELAVTGPGSGLWRRVIPGNRITASISGNGLIAFEKNMSVLALQRLLIQGTQVSIMGEIDEGGRVSYETMGYITRIELTGANKSPGAFTYQIAVDGEVLITSTYVPDPNEVGFTNELLLGDGTSDKLATEPGVNNNLLI